MQERHGCNKMHLPACSQLLQTEMHIHSSDYGAGLISEYWNDSLLHVPANEEAQRPVLRTCQYGTVGKVSINILCLF